MTGQRGEQAGRTRPWPSLGLLLVALFLGHDAIMAAEVVAAPSQFPGAHHPTADPHARPAGTPVPYSLAPESEHLANCGVAQPALAPRGDDGSGTGQVPMAANIGLLGCFSAASIGSFAWAEPHRPPGIVRALLQVYRL